MYVCVRVHKFYIYDEIYEIYITPGNPGAPISPGNPLSGGKFMPGSPFGPYSKQNILKINFQQFYLCSLILYFDNLKYRFIAINIK